MALGRNIWLDLGIFKVYPNLYTVLVASSGRHRKSTAIDQITRLVRRIEPRPNIIGQKITPEALIQAMKSNTNPAMVMSDRCEGVVVADEFATFLNKQTYEAGMPSLLIQFYDCKDEFEYRTKTQGTDTVKNSCLNLLAGTTVEWLRVGIPEDAIGGGLTSRMLFIWPDEIKPPVAIPTMDEKQIQLAEELVAELNRISCLSGLAQLDPEARKVFEDLYEKNWNSSDFDDPLLVGHMSRKPIHILKIALLLCAQDSTGLVVQPRHILGASKLMEAQEVNLRKVLELLTTTLSGARVEEVARLIRANGTITRQALTGALSHRMGFREMTEVLAMLVEQGKVRSQMLDGASVYVWKSER